MSCLPRAGRTQAWTQSQASSQLAAICAASTSHYCIVKKGYGFGRLIFTWGVSTMTAGLAHEMGYAARLVAPLTGTASNSACMAILSVCIIGLEVGGAGGCSIGQPFVGHGSAQMML